jgi:hypothetical protein
MSRNFKNNSTPKPMQKFCKVCQDAGKSESEYRSHFTRETREANSNVTCPTLLALECRYCYKNGHTVKYCPVLKNNEKQQKREQKSYHHIDTSSKKTTKILTNVFACLEIDSDEEEQQISKKLVTKVTKKSVTKVEVKEDFPVLCATSICVPKLITTSNYALALTAPVPDTNPNVTTFPPMPELKRTTATSYHAPWVSKIPILDSQMKWAAMDSDSEEDEKGFKNDTNLLIVEDDCYDSNW